MDRRTVLVLGLVPSHGVPSGPNTDPFHTNRLSSDAGLALAPYIKHKQEQYRVRPPMTVSQRYQCRVPSNQPSNTSGGSCVIASKSRASRRNAALDVAIEHQTVTQQATTPTPTTTTERESRDVVESVVRGGRRGVTRTRATSN
jgi:hypothetical protein